MISTNSPWVIALSALIAITLLLSPPELFIPARAALRDLLVPGQQTVASLLDVGRRQITGGADVTHAEARQKPELLERRERQWLVREAELQNSLREARQAAGLLTSEVSPPLYTTDAIQVQVLNQAAAEHWRSRPTLGGGSHAGVRELALVLDDPRPLLDQGENQGVEADMPIFAGGTVVGKVARVGHFSSTLCRVTDPEFTGAARLARQTSTGTQYGAAGVVLGDGTPECRLMRVPATEPVSEGDLVVTGENEDTPAPQVYGSVVRTELPDGALEWKIWIKPAAPEHLKTVAIVRTRLNSARVTANP